MDIIKFYNRENELKLLEIVRRPIFAIIYERRRVGKTTLALKFCEGNDFLYFFVNPKKQKFCIVLKLEPLDFKTVFNILDEAGIRDIEEKFKIYLVFGGISHYYY
jgi:AAA+ ATPase superfamily predicted ATPase